MELEDADCAADGVVVMLQGAGTKQDTAAAVALSKSAEAKTAAAAEASDAPSKSSSLPDAVKEVMKLSFPRCSVCKTGWYEAIEGDANDSDDGDKKPAAVDNNNRKRKRHRQRPSPNDLIAMPECSCTTLLALPHDMPSVIFSEGGCSNPVDVLSQIKTHSFSNLAVCKCCLRERIRVSKEVIEHDYRQEHIPNGQRNVRFTADTNCVQCKRKFMGRVLERLLDSEGGTKSSNGGGRGRKKNGKQEADWQEAVKATIQLVGWAKQSMNRERKLLRRSKRDEKMNGGDHVDRSEQDPNGWWKKYCEEGDENDGGFTGGDGNCSSDECYSLSSDSCDGWDSDDNDIRPSKGVHRVELQSGELRKELMKKDPIFRQELEDEQYVQELLEAQKKKEEQRKKEEEKKNEEYLKKLLEKEKEEQRRAAEERERKDRELAMKFKKKWEEEEKKMNRYELRRTRSKSPLVAAFKKTPSASNENSDKKLSPTAKSDEVSERKKKSASPAHSGRGGSSASAEKSDRKPPPVKSEGTLKKSEGASQGGRGGSSAYSTPSSSAKASSEASSNTIIDLVESSDEDDTRQSDQNVARTPVSNEVAEDKAVEENASRLSDQNVARTPVSDESAEDKAVEEILAMGMGFTEASARRCLKNANGDANKAVAMLFSEAADNEECSDN